MGRSSKVATRQTGDICGSDERGYLKKKEKREIWEEVEKKTGNPIFFFHIHSIAQVRQVCLF